MNSETALIFHITGTVIVCGDFTVAYERKSKRKHAYNCTILQQIELFSNADGRLTADCALHLCIISTEGLTLNWLSSGLPKQNARLTNLIACFTSARYHCFP